MAGIITISPGHDASYPWRQIGTSTEAGKAAKARADIAYYLSPAEQGGEPPGRWRGDGLQELGFHQDQIIDRPTFEALYGSFTDPRDPTGQTQLGRSRRRMAAGRRRHLGLHRHRQPGRPGLPPARGRLHPLGLPRPSGQRHHDRPVGGRTPVHHRQLPSAHQARRRPSAAIHNLVLNRVQRERDGAWRTLDSKALDEHRGAAAAMASLVMESELSREFGVRWVQRPDGHGREIRGVSQALMDQFSSRRQSISALTRKLAREFEWR